MDKRYVIVVEDSETLLKCIEEQYIIFCDKFDIPHYEYISFDTSAKAVAFLECNRNVAVLITDVQLEEDSSGMELATYFCHNIPLVPVYIMTRSLPKTKIYPIMNLPHVRHIKKPLSASDIEKMFKQALFYSAE